MPGMLHHVRNSTFGDIGFSYSVCLSSRDLFTPKIMNPGVAC